MEQLRIDPAYLQSRFYNLSRILHPDRYSRKSAKEQDFSLQATALLNDAYRTLRDPVARAEYVMKLHGLDIGEQRSKNVPAELLEEVFELNEVLDELRSGDQDARPRLGEELERFKEMRGEIDRELDHLFEQYDKTRRHEVLSHIRAVLNRRRYVSHLIEDVEKELG